MARPIRPKQYSVRCKIVTSKAGGKVVKPNVVMTYPNLVIPYGGCPRDQKIWKKQKALGGRNV